MSSDRLLTALIIGLLATSVGSSIAAVHFYQLGLGPLPMVSGIDNEIGVLGRDLFESNNMTIDVDSPVAQLLSLNSTSQHGN
ncbi:MAG TPA: hypothetical protein VIK88_01565 [Candidatus Bathyarchaeia archaeon]